MARYTFYTNPMSRGQIVRWALHEVDAPYDEVFVNLFDIPEALRAINPMGKVPTLIHHHPASGDHVVTESAAICMYLARMHPSKGLLPTETETADYLRWIMFGAGPFELAMATWVLDVHVSSEKELLVGWGSYELTVRTLETLLSSRDYICGERFTMADVFMSCVVDWSLIFGSLEPRPAFVAYADRVRDRPAYQSAKAIDNALIEQQRRGQL